MTRHPMFPLCAVPTCALHRVLVSQATDVKSNQHIGARVNNISTFGQSSPCDLVLIDASRRQQPQILEFYSDILPVPATSSRRGQLTLLGVHIVVQSCVRSLTGRDSTTSATPGLCSTQLGHQSARPNSFQFNLLLCCGVTLLAAECSSFALVVLERVAAELHMAIFVAAAAAEVGLLIVQR